MNETEGTLFWQNLTKTIRVTWRNFSFEAINVWHVAQDSKAETAARAILYGALVHFTLLIWCVTSC